MFYMLVSYRYRYQLRIEGKNRLFSVFLHTHIVPVPGRELKEKTPFLCLFYTLELDRYR